VRIGTKVIAALGVAIVAVGGAGVAKAAGGGPVVAGHSNTAAKTTTLKSKHGPALSLKSHGPALKVNNSKLVHKLNAQLLDGQSASQIGQIAQSLGSFTGGGAYILCPKGTTPVGGGVIPDNSGADDNPYVIVSFPHVTSTGKLNGWLGVAGDDDGSYNGEGLVYVSCSTSETKLSQRTVKRAGPELRRARVMRAKPVH
jgi:hypothetical protein